MEINEKNLSRAGFNYSEIQKIRRNTENYGGTFHDALSDLARRFRIVFWVILCSIIVFILLLFFCTEDKIIAGGVGLLFGIGVALFSQPPIIAYKAWRYSRYTKQ